MSHRVLRRVFSFASIVAAVAAVAVLAWQLLKPPELAIVSPTRGPAVEAVYATGTVEPTLEIRIAPRVAGRIVELRVDEGDGVQQGELLARLEDSDLRAQVRELEARVKYAQAQYDRNVELRGAALIPQDALDLARTELDAARASLARAREQLGYMRLTAPVDGRIIRRDGEIGELIPVNQPIFFMAGPEPLRITADVDEEDVPRVKAGLPVLIHTDAFPERVFDGTVDQVTPRGDATARSYRVRIALDGEPPLRIGMTVETNIVIERRENALLVPTSAVLDGQVWVVNDERAHPRDVDTGVVGPERTEILAGVEEGARILVQPPEDVEAGMRVRAP